MLGKRDAACFFGESCQPGVRADDRALAFLSDDRGVLGRHEFRECRHAGTS